MHALDKDALDVCRFRGAGHPDDIRVVGHGGQGVGHRAVDGVLAHHGNMDPRGERGQTVGRRFVGENDRA